MALIEKGKLIYELSDRETVYVAFNAAVGTVLNLVRDSHLTWKELEELLIEQYADEGTATETMRSLIKLVQLKEETPGELGIRVEKLTTLAFPEEVRNNAIMQLADL